MWKIQTVEDNVNIGKTCVGHGSEADCGCQKNNNKLSFLYTENSFNFISNDGTDRGYLCENRIHLKGNGMNISAGTFENKVDEGSISLKNS